MKKATNFNVFDYTEALKMHIDMSIACSMEFDHKDIWIDIQKDMRLHKIRRILKLI